jgi:hypothetical protein
VFFWLQGCAGIVKKAGKNCRKKFTYTYTHGGKNYFDGHIPTFYRTWIRLYRGTKNVAKMEIK